MDADNEYLAALSISSLASDDERSEINDEVLPSTHLRPIRMQKLVPSYPQVKEQGEFRNHKRDMSMDSEGGQGPYLNYFRLEKGHATYATIEQGGRGVCLQFTIEKDLSVRDVVAVSLYCVPNYIMDDDLIASAKRRRQRGLDFIGLDFDLTMNELSPHGAHRTDESDENFSLGNSQAANSRHSRKSTTPDRSRHGAIKMKTHLFNGTYTLVISTAHGALRAGEYNLCISIQPERDEDGNEKVSFLYHQDIRASYNIVPEVKATSLPTNSTTLVSVGCKEFAYYRVVLADRTQMISFRTESSKGDVEIFITNQFDSLVPVDQQNAVWRSRDPGNSRIDILPDDLGLAESTEQDNSSSVETFLVGLFGSSDGVNQCTFSILTSAPVSVTRFVLTSEYDEEDRDYQASRSNNTSNLDPKGRCESEPLVLPLHEYRYFSAVFNPVERAKIAVVMDLHSLSTSGGHLKLSYRYRNVETLAHDENVDLTVGSAVYGEPESLRFFSDSGIDGRVNGSGSSNGHNGNGRSSVLSPPPQARGGSDNGSAAKSSASTPATRTVSESLFQHTPGENALASERDQYMVVLYISHDIPYPSHTDYTWKVSGHDKAVFIIDTSEWRYLSNTCYFSAIAFKYKPVNLEKWVPNIELDEIDSAVALAIDVKSSLNGKQQSGDDPVSPPDLAASTGSQAISRLLSHSNKREFMAECSVWLEDEEKWLLSSEMYQQKFKIFDDLYRSIDGFRLSYKDRREMLAGSFECDLPAEEFDNLDDHTLTYGETEFNGFRELLISAGAVDGQIFYDLGSGVGKGMIAAALSGICFVKVIGIEILPSLIQCCRDVIEELTTQVRLTHNTSLNQSSQNYNTSGTGLMVRSHSNLHGELQANQALANMFPPLSPVTSSRAGGVGREANREHIMVGTGGTTANQNISGFTGMDDLSVVSSSTYSYQVNAIPDLKEKLKKAKISLPMLETR